MYPHFYGEADSRYKRIASLIFLSASFFVLPSLIHPGKEGTVTEIPPSSLGSRMNIKSWL